MQAISNYRATLDGTRSSDLLKNDDQWILNTTSNTPVLVPSNGYTFERTPWQARVKPDGASGYPVVCSHLWGHLMLQRSGKDPALSISRFDWLGVVPKCACTPSPLCPNSALSLMLETTSESFLHSRDDLIATQTKEFASLLTRSRAACTFSDTRREWFSPLAGDPDLHGGRRQRPGPVFPQRPEHQQRHERDQQGYRPPCARVHHQRESRPLLSSGTVFIAHIPSLHSRLDDAQQCDRAAHCALDCCFIAPARLDTPAVTDSR